MCICLPQKQCPSIREERGITFVYGSSIYVFKLCIFSHFKREAKYIHSDNWVPNTKFGYFDNGILQSICVIDLYHLISSITPSLISGILLLCFFFRCEIFYIYKKVWRII